MSMDIARWHFAAAEYWMAIADQTIPSTINLMGIVGADGGTVSSIVPHSECVETAKVHLAIAQFALDYENGPFVDGMGSYVPLRNEEVEKKCCNGGPQWGHSWNCPSLP
jgi:hypothetical protein